MVINMRRLNKNIILEKKKMCFNNRSVFYSVMISLFAFSCHRPGDTLFESLPSSKTNIDFVNKLEKHKAFNILYYLYYYNGGGVAIGDINNDGLPDIYFTANNKGGNKLFLNKGNFVFEDITDKAGVAGTSDWCTGATMADVNGDGLLDIYVCSMQGEHGLKGHNELFINNGNGTFTESAKKYGLDLAAYSTQAVFFDYDHDGDLDCFILNQSTHPDRNIVDTSNRREFDPNAGDRLYRLHYHRHEMKKLFYLCLMTCSSILLADETPSMELKHKSSFNVEANERNPFWPIGWKPAPKMAKTGPDHAGPAIPPSSFVVSSITLDPKAHYAIINGRTMSEGQQFGLQLGNQIYQITVKAINDGHVVLLRHDQEIIVPLRRK